VSKGRNRSLARTQGGLFRLSIYDLKPILFPYRKEKIPSGIIYRPVAKVKLFGPKSGPVVELFYVDSGADCTLIPLQLGQLLGLQAMGKARKIGGIGGSIETFQNRLTIEIGGWQFSCLLAWAQTDKVPNLLGRQDVFDHFDILFSQRRCQVTFNPVPISRKPRS